MSGRAGRRGKDDRGIVIQMLDEKMEPAVCKDILYGAPDPLNSSYRISYNMLLNLLRVEDVDPEYLLRASFHQFQREQNAPALIAKAEDLEQDAERIELGSSEDTELATQYYQMDHQLLVTRRSIAKTIQNPDYILKFLQAPGRFVDVTIDGENYGWGVLVKCSKMPGSGGGGDAGRMASAMTQQYTLDVLLQCVDRHFDSADSKGKDEDAANAGLLWRGKVSSCRPVTKQDEDDKEKLVSMRVFTVGLDSIGRISAVRIFIPQDVTIPEARKKVAMSVKEVATRFPEGIPLLDPVTDLGIKDDAFQTLLKRAETLTERMASHKLATDYEEEKRIALVQACEKKMDFLKQAKAFRDEARSCQTMAMKDELKKMKRVLKKLGHVDADGVIQTKGRTACEINTADELVVVEMIFAGVFNDLSSEQCVAVLSCMTFDERNKDEDDPAKGMKSFLSSPFYKLQEIARTVVRVKIACGLEIDEDEFVDKFNPGM
jgi:ATP-dependent RNA helicase DOB1